MAEVRMASALRSARGRTSMPQHPNDPIERLHAGPEPPAKSDSDEDTNNGDDNDADGEDVDPDSAESDVDRDDMVTE
jgi:hypothetical protein